MLNVCIQAVLSSKWNKPIVEQMGRCLPRRICGGKSVKNQQWHLHKSTGYQDSLAFYEMNQNDMGMGQNLVPLVNIKIAGKWMFIPLKMVLIGIDTYPYL